MVILLGLFHFLLKKLEWDHLGVLDIPVDKEVAEHKQMFLTCLMYLILTWLCGYFGGAGVGLSLKRLSIISHPAIIVNRWIV